MNKIITIIFFVLIGAFIIQLQAQNNLCNQANPFCTGTTYNFPAGVGAGSAQPGANYGCLFTQPNPAWYFMQVGTSGPIEIEMHSVPQRDIDFACWGPFTDPTSPCVAQLTAGAPTPSHAAPGASANYPTLNMVDCSYSTSWQEWCYIPNAVSGQYYLLLITNYSNQPCNIIFSQTGGTGTTNCGILPPPIVNNGPLCIGQTLQLTVSSPPSGATYSWTGPGGFTSNVMNPTRPNVTAAMAGTYSLTITIGSQTSPAVTTTVVVNPNPTVSISPSNPSTCSGSPVSLTPSCTTGLAWYNWSNGTQGTGGITVSPTTPTSYSVIGTDQNGCSGTASVTVNINPDLVLSINPTNPYVCVGSTVNLTAIGANNYTWSPSSSLSSASGTTVTASPIVATTYTVVGTETTGCTGTASVTVNINPDLILSVNPPNPSVCIGSSIPLTASGADTYTWSPTASLSSGSGATVSASPTTATTYTVVGTANNGCTGTSTVTVNINPDLTLSVLPSNPSICLGTSTPLTAYGGDTYTWLPSGSLSSSSGTTVTASPNVITTYTVTGTDIAGCTGTCSVTVDVTPGPPISINASPGHVCPGDSSLLSVSLLATSYTWSPSASLSSPGGQSTTARPNSTTTYSVLADNNGCSSTAEYTLVVSPVPNVDFISDFREGCQGLKVNFQDLTSPAVSNWSWIFGDNASNGNTSTMQNPVHNYSKAGTFDVTLSVITVDGCKKAITYPEYIYIHPLPYADFEVTPGIVNELDPLVFFTDKSVDANVWNWYFGERNPANNTSFLQNPNHLYSEIGIFNPTLVVFSGYGCSDTATGKVTVEQNMTFYIPNAFTPNDDGKNSVFKPLGEGIDLKTFEMRIYNRWGEPMIFTRDMNEGWDGKVKGGKLAEPGVYTYLISYYDVKHKYHSLKGFVMLLK